MMTDQNRINLLKSKRLKTGVVEVELDYCFMTYASDVFIGEIVEGDDGYHYFRTAGDEFILSAGILKNLSTYISEMNIDGSTFSND